jgi:hypothetical protein
MNENKLDIASKLFSLATTLDLKGLNKIASDLDKIAEDWLGRSDEFAESMGGTAEPMDFDMTDLRSGAVEKYDRNRDSRPGRIRPSGDEFTYDYLVGEDKFVVRHAPDKYYSSIGQKFGPGHAAYNNLRSYLGSDFNGIKDEYLLTDKITEDEVEAPEFGGHSGMQILRDDVAGRVGADAARAMFNAADNALGRAYKNRSLTRGGADQMLTSAGFNAKERSDYLFAIRHLFDYIEPITPSEMPAETLQTRTP